MGVWGSAWASARIAVRAETGFFTEKFTGVS